MRIPGDSVGYRQSWNIDRGVGGEEEVGGVKV